MKESGLWVVEQAGSRGPHVVMIHGAMDRHNSFRRTMTRLGEHHISVYDRRGYGRSEQADATCDFAKHVADLMTIVDDEPAVLIGHSMGGLVALHAAAVYPKRILAVGAFEPPVPWKPWWPDLWIPDPSDSNEEVVRNFHERVMGPDSWNRIASTLRAQYIGEGHALRNDLEVGLHNPLFDPVEIVAPVVMGHGSGSTPHHIRAVTEFADELPDAELVVIEGSAHGAHRSHPDAFSQFVAQTIARVPRSQ